MIFTSLQFAFNYMFKTISTLLIRLKALHFALDPIQDCSTLDEMPTEHAILKATELKESLIKRFWTNIHYFIPFLSMIYINLDTVWILSKAHFVYNATGIPDLFTHSIYPPEFWLQGTMITSIGIQTEMFCFGMLSLNPQLDPRHCLYAVRGDLQGRSVRIYSNGKGI